MLVAVAALVLAVPSTRAARPAFTFRATAPATIRAGSAAVVLHVRSSAPAGVDATLYRSGLRLATWERSVAAGAGRLRLALSPRSRVPGHYTLLVRASAGGETIYRTVRFRIISQPTPRAMRDAARRPAS